MTDRPRRPPVPLLLAVRVALPGTYLGAAYYLGLPHPELPAPLAAAIYGTAIVGPVADAGGRARLGTQLRREITELTARHCGRPVDAVEADADAGRWLTATEAVEYGLVDSLLPG